jgi:hypothetical protein
MGRTTGQWRCRICSFDRWHILTVKCKNGAHHLLLRLLRLLGDVLEMPMVISRERNLVTTLFCGLAVAPNIGISKPLISERQSFAPPKRDADRLPAECLSDRLPLQGANGPELIASHAVRLHRKTPVEKCPQGSSGKSPLRLQPHAPRAGRSEGKGFMHAAVRACVAGASPMDAGDLSCCHGPAQTGKQRSMQSIRPRWRLARGALKGTLKAKRRPKVTCCCRKFLAAGYPVSFFIVRCMRSWRHRLPISGP